MQLSSHWLATHVGSHLRALVGDSQGVNETKGVPVEGLTVTQ